MYRQEAQIQAGVSASSTPSLSPGLCLEHALDQVDPLQTPHENNAPPLT